MEKLDKLPLFVLWKPLTWENFPLAIALIYVDKRVNLNEQ